MKSKFGLLLILGILASQTGCDRVRNEWNYRQHVRREKIFTEDMERIGQDTQGAYCFEYVLDDTWMQVVVADQPQMRALPDGKFEATAWVGLQNLGGAPSDITSVLFDPSARTITVIDTGPNIVLIGQLLGPMRPARYREIKRPAPTTAVMP